MNGRCETDPLDRAVDVCDSCYGEFCKVCLVLPKGRRHPICTHCTLVLSGVRGHATVQPRGDRRTAKQRRAELLAATAEPSDDRVFRFFDADDEPAAAEADGPGRKGGRRSPRRDRRARSAPVEGSGGPKPGAAPLPLPAEVAAAAAELKAAASDGTDQNRAGSNAARPGPAGEPTDPTELVTVTRAVARLEELRRQGTPPAGSPVPPVPDSPTARSASPAGPVADVPGAAGPPSDGPNGNDETDGAGGPDDTAHVAAPAGRAGGPPPKPKPTAAPRPDRRRPEGADRHGQPPTAPMVGEVRTIGGRRSSDQAPPPQPARPRTAPATPAAEVRPAPADTTTDDDDLVDVGEALSGVERFDARQPVSAVAPAGSASSSRTAEERKADTDSQGNWIPPILRGMAPDAREAKTNLPQRKRGS